MCTVIVQQSTDDEQRLIIGANRDEDVLRHSGHFGWHDSGHALHPTDVGGGTWIGVNDDGIFAALTNRDDVVHKPNRRSRGALVRRALEARSIVDVTYWVNWLDPSRYNGFRLIIVDRTGCHIWEGDGRSSQPALRYFPPDNTMHVITGFGVDTWHVERCKRIRDDLWAAPYANDFKRALALHVTGKVADDVCIHDPTESHQTRSSCIITANATWDFHVEAVNVPPCKATNWDAWDVKNVRR